MSTAPESRQARNWSADRNSTFSNSGRSQSYSLFAGRYFRPASRGPRLRFRSRCRPRPIFDHDRRPLRGTDLLSQQAGGDIGNPSRRNGTMSLMVFAGCDHTTWPDGANWMTVEMASEAVTALSVCTLVPLQQEYRGNSPSTVSMNR